MVFKTECTPDATSSLVLDANSFTLEICTSKFSRCLASCERKFCRSFSRVKYLTFLAAIESSDKSNSFKVSLVEMKSFSDFNTGTSSNRYSSSEATSE